MHKKNSARRAGELDTATERQRAERARGLALSESAATGARNFWTGKKK